jgi:hypothetical protein
LAYRSFSESAAGSYSNAEWLVLTITSMASNSRKFPAAFFSLAHVHERTLEVALCSFVQTLEEDTQSNHALLLLAGSQGESLSIACASLAKSKQTPSLRNDLAKLLWKVPRYDLNLWAGNAPSRERVFQRF